MTVRRSAYARAPIDTIALLSPSECDSIVAAIHGLRKRWIPRSDREPCAFFTLGAASYMDAPANLARLRRVYNPILRASFGPLLELVRGTLSRCLGEPARFDDKLALPGFHIWQAPAIFTGPFASIHFDVQYRKIRWPRRLAPDFKRSMSLTLPIRLPRAGGGLTHWNVHFDQYCALCQEAGRWIDAEDMTRGAVSAHHAYTAGALAVHSGHMLHQIAPVPRVDPNDERITLQGHVVPCEGEWILYW